MLPPLVSILPTAAGLAAVACLSVAQAQAPPVITELMFHPPHAERTPEPVDREWLELYNPGPTADLSGWRLTRGVSIEFPPGTVVPAGGRLVVAATETGFRDAYPEFTGLLVAGWSGRLSNRGENVRLVDRDGVRVDEVEYADEGDWATRGRTAADAFGQIGWEWDNPADGGGRTLEKNVERLRGSFGRNWRASVVAGGTPGAANSVAGHSETAFITNVRANPVIPRPGQPVVVTATIHDVQSGNQPAAWRLRWRLDGEPEFQSLNMDETAREPMNAPDPAGHRLQVTATLPPQPNRTIIEFYVEAHGSDGYATWPPAARTSAPDVDPPTFAQATNALIQVDDSFAPAAAWLPGAQPIYRLVLTAAELAALRRLQTNSSFSESAATMHATFVALDGTGLAVRWQCGVRNRGYSSRNGPPNNYHLSFPRDARWQDLGSVQFNCRFPHSQVLGTATYALAGIPVQEAAPVQVRLNGTNYAVPFSPGNNFTGSITFGSYARVETLGSDWTERHYPEDSEGNLYRVDDHRQGNASVSNRFRYPGSDDPDLYDDIYIKQTHQDVNDYRDLAALFNALNNTPPEQFYQEIQSHLNLDQWLTYLAIDALMGNQEGGLVSGRTDDFSMYRGVTDPRFVLVPHDMDTTFNYGSGGAGNPVTRSLFTYVTAGGGLTGLQTFFNDPDILRAYYAKTLALMETVFHRQRLDPLIDQLMSGWVDASAIQTAKSFIDARRTNVLNQIPRRYSIMSDLSATTDGYRVTTSGNAVISGNFDVSRTRSVMVNGRPALLFYRASGNIPAGTWQFNTTSTPGFLNHGINRVTADFFDGKDGTGTLLHRATLDILNTASGTMTQVTSGGLPLGSTLFIECPATYLPGIPILVKIERRDAVGRVDRSVWEESVTLTASNGVTLAAADGGPATVTLLNGRGSRLITVGGGAGPVRTFVEPGGTRQAPSADPALWKYLDSGDPPAANWMMPHAYDDGFWKPEGSVGAPGQFGAGDDDERTVVANVPTSSSASNPRWTWYFRHRFDVADPSVLASLSMQVLADDGAAVYLNGVEVVRTNLAPNATHTTPATSNRSGSAENAFLSFNVPVATLVPGENLVAVELHNARTATNTVSLDLGFDLGLRGTEISLDPGNFTLTATVGPLNATRAVASLGQTPPVTEVTGVLNEDTIWSGVVHITGDVTVPADRTLTIAPGTHVLMAGTTTAGSTTGSDLIVQGTLTIAGTQAEPVSLTAAEDGTHWGEILLTGGGESSITHGFISRGAHSPGRGHTGRGPVIRLNNASLTIDDSVLADAPGKAVYTQGTGNLVIRRSHLARCVTGPELENGMALLLEDSHLTHFLPEYRPSHARTPDDEDCLYFHNAAGRPVVLRGSVLGRCGDDVIDGLGGPISIDDCIIRDGWDKGISLLNNDLTMTRSLVIGCDKAVVPKSNSATTRTITLHHCTLVSADHDTTLGPWGYPIAPTNPDADTPSTGLYTQNKSGQSHAAATLAIAATNCLIIAREPVKVDAPYLPSHTVVRFSITRDSDQPESPPWPGTGNLNADPLFVSTTPGSLDFHLQADSPAIDAGDPASPPDDNGSRADIGALPFGGIPVGPASDIVWRASQSPLHITQNITIPAGTTLTVEPGVSAYFDRNRRLTVNGVIKVLGTAHARVTFSHLPGTIAPDDADPISPGIQSGPPKWGGLRLVDSLDEENIISHADFINAQGTSARSSENFGSLGIIRSWALCEYLTFTGTKLRMLYGRNCKLTVQYCHFPDMFEPGEDPLSFDLDNVAEQLKVEFPSTDPEVRNARFVDGFPVGGWWRVYHNDFYSNKGHNDVFDADSGRWGQTPVLDCRYNRFHGVTGDEHIDLGGDAYIASNIFQRGRKDQWNYDTGYSSAISSGDRGTGTTIMVARNVFTEVDHAINLKARTGTIFEHNTTVHFNPDYEYISGPPLNLAQSIKNSLVNLFIPEDFPTPTAGDGGYLGFNLVSDVPRLVSGADHDTNGLGAITSKLEFHYNLLNQVYDHTIGPNHPGGIFAPQWGVNLAGPPGLVNPAAGDFRLTVESLARGSAPGGLDIGATIPEWTYLLGGPPTLSPHTSASFLVGGPGIVAYRWRLNGGDWSAPLTIGTGGVFPRNAPTVRQTTLTLDNMPAGPHLLHILGQDFAGNWQPEDSPTTRSWTVDPALRLILINEVVADAGSDPDWIELHNAGALTVDLGGWQLGEHPEPSGYSLPHGTVLAPGATVRLTADVTGIHSDKDGDAVYLWEGANLRDSVCFGAQPAGYSLARLGPDRAWGLGLPTPAAENEAARLGDPRSLRINEFLAATDVRYQSDWVELYNPRTFPVALEGMVLTDNLPGRPRAHVMAPLSFIGPGGHVSYWAGGEDSSGTPNHLPFRLNAMEDRLLLLDPAGNVIDERVFYGQTHDFSQSFDAIGRPVFHELPTRGFDLHPSDPSSQNAIAILRSLRITEIMYNAREGNDADWLELRNTGATPIDLNGVHFVEGINFTFPSLILPPGALIVLVANEAVFRVQYGSGPTVAGTYAGRLDNSGETLTLRLAPPFDANILRFRYENHWHPETNGPGRSLDLIHLNTPLAEFGHASSWSASATFHGTPGIGTQPAPPTFAGWKSEFTISDDLIDDDDDGLLPLMEYALGCNPRLGTGNDGPSALPTAALSPAGRLTLTLRLPVNPMAPQNHGRAEVRYEVQSASSLNNWTTQATKSHATPWSGTATVTLGTVENGVQTVVVTDTASPPAAPRHFRLLVRWEP